MGNIQEETDTENCLVTPSNNFSVNYNVLISLDALLSKNNIKAEFSIVRILLINFRQLSCQGRIIRKFIFL